MLISRQPVFDSRTQVVGYESEVHWKAVSNGARADVLNLIVENLDSLAGDGWALIALPADFIEAGGHEMLASDRAILEPLGRPTDVHFQRSVARISSRGYRMAVCPEGEVAAGAGAEMVRLRFSAGSRDATARQILQLKSANNKVLVDGIDTAEDFAFCKDSGVDFYGGRFFCQPGEGSGDLPLGRLPTFRLLAALQNPNVRLQELEDLVRYDLPLSYKLLRFANSPYVGLSRPVESLKHAVGLVGIDRIRKWASVLLVSSFEDKPRELYATAAIRGRMCELLADSEDEGRQSTYFTTGLLSVLDAALDRELEAVVSELSIHPEIREALVCGTGIVGATLDAVMSYEAGDWESRALRPFPPLIMRNAYFEALRWFRTVGGDLLM